MEGSACSLVPLDTRLPHQPLPWRAPSDRPSPGPALKEGPWGA